MPLSYPGFDIPPAPVFLDESHPAPECNQFDQNRFSPYQVGESGQEKVMIQSIKEIVDIAMGNPRLLFIFQIMLSSSDRFEVTLTGAITVTSVQEYLFDKRLYDLKNSGLNNFVDYCGKSKLPPFVFFIEFRYVGG